MSKSILALDLGLKTGWAVYNKDVLLSGMENLKIRKGNPRCLSMMKYSIWLAEMLEKHAVTHVYYEEVMAHAATRAAHVYGALECATEIECYLKKITPVGVSVGTIKLFATGNGHAKKDEMVYFAQQFKPNITSDDEADAFHLLRYAVKNTD